MSEDRVRSRKSLADRTVVRSLLAAFVLFAVLVGVVSVFANLKHRADREAIRDAYLDGRLSRAEAAELLGANADLPKRPISK